MGVTADNVAAAIGQAAVQSRDVVGPVCEGWLAGWFKAIWRSAKEVDRRNASD